MELANQIFFLIFALIALALFLSAIFQFKIKQPDWPSIYWPISIGLYFISCLSFGLAPWLFKPLLTLANFSFLSSTMGLVFLYRSWNNKLFNKLQTGLLIAIPIFVAVFYESLRVTPNSFQQRVALITISIEVFLAWQVWELIRYYKKEQSTIGALLLLITIVNLLASLSRTILILTGDGPTNIFIYVEDHWALASRGVMNACNILTSVVLGAFYLQKQLIKENKISNALYEATQENARVNTLLIEKNELLDQLSEEKLKSERANLAKNQFLANMSHEIRTPLHGVIGLTSMVLRSSMSEEIRRSLDKVLYSSKALLVILNDILDFSKIEAGVIEIHQEPFKVKHLMDDIKDLFSIPAMEKGILLKFDIDPAIPEVMIGDFYKLRQVLFNLVGNSIKFTKQGDVEVQVRLDQREADAVRLTMTVKDQGIGISEKNLAVIFEPFNQLDNTNIRRYDGVGLGLPITQNILLQMGSELVIKSQLGVGTESRFSICLGINNQIPYQHRTLSSFNLEEQTNLPYPSLAGRHVLVAEDNPINVEVIRQYLNFLKIESHFVTDGLQCIDALKSNAYDCVLIDIQMPNLDGLQATQQIRLIQDLKELPIIGLSAGVAQSDREIGLASGMNDFLVKPFELEVLAQTLIKYCQ